MKKSRIFFVSFSLLITSACQWGKNDYLIYVSSEDPDIAYVISRSSGRYFVGENSWKFSIGESDFDKRFYPSENNISISLPQINLALPIDKYPNNWMISNISCKKLTGSSQSYQARCVTNGRNETEFGYENGGVVFFSAKCTLSDETCKYHLRDGIGFGSEIVKGWLGGVDKF